MILVSSCLTVLKVRYDGNHCLVKKIEKLIKEKKAIVACPEILAGLSTPREPAEIVGGNGDDVLDGKAKVIEKSGKDVTDIYIKGAIKTLEIVLNTNINKVILKEYSPSCGTSMIYNGEFIGKKMEGNGVTAALLKRNGIEILSEEQFLNSF